MSNLDGNTLALLGAAIAALAGIGSAKGVGIAGQARSTTAQSQAEGDDSGGEQLGIAHRVISSLSDDH